MWLLLVMCIHIYLLYSLGKKCKASESPCRGGLQDEDFRCKMDFKCKAVDLGVAPNVWIFYDFIYRHYKIKRIVSYQIY